MATAVHVNETNNGKHRRAADPVDRHAVMVTGREAYQSIKESQRQLWPDCLVVDQTTEEEKTNDT